MTRGTPAHQESKVKKESGVSFFNQAVHIWDTAGMEKGRDMPVTRRDGAFSS